MFTSKGGYVLVDCKGLDLTKGSTEQTITGLFTRLVDVMKSGKPVIAVNLKWGTETITPTLAMLLRIDEDTIVATAHTLQIWVKSSDVVTIVNLAPQE